MRIKNSWIAGRNVLTLLLAFGSGYLLAIPSAPLAQSQPIAEFLPQTIVLGPLEFDGKKSGCGLLVTVAILMQLPTIWQFVKVMLVHRAEHKPNTVAQSSEVKAANLVYVNTVVDVPSVPYNPVAETDPVDLFNEGVHAGTKYGFGTVAQQLIAKIRTEAASLINAFSEEDHATRFRKSKLNRLTDFCARLETATEEPWLLQACESYKGTFEEKCSVLSSSATSLDELRMELFRLDQRYQKTERKENRGIEVESRFEAEFSAIYSKVVDELSYLCKALLKINAQCASEFSQASATSHLSETRKRLA